MKYIFVIFLSLFLTLCPAQAQIITGGVEYNEASARSEMLETNPLKINSNLINSNIVDKNKIDNFVNLLKGQTDLKDRILATFSDGSYGVIYKDNPMYVWYYQNDGVLMHSEVKTSLDYPYKTYKYTPDGKLVNMSLRVSKTESFVFSKTGELLAHWNGNFCYDKNNNVIMTRKILE